MLTGGVRALQSSSPTEVLDMVQGLSPTVWNSLLTETFGDGISPHTYWSGTLLHQALDPSDLILELGCLLETVLTRLSELDLQEIR